MLWNVISSMLDPGTRKKTKIYGENYMGDLASIINITQIEKKYKGTAENVERKYFPPIFPSDQYLTEKDNKEELLLPEEKYIEKLRSNNKIKPSPYILRENENITFQTLNSNVLVKKIISNEGIINTVYEEAKSQGSIKINNQKYEEFFEKKSKCFEEEVEFNIKICGQANDANDKSYINNDQYEKSIGNESDIKTNFSKKNKLNNKTTLEIKEEMSCSKTQKNICEQHKSYCF